MQAGGLEYQKPHIFLKIMTRNGIKIEDSVLEQYIMLNSSTCHNNKNEFIITAQSKNICYL